MQFLASVSQRTFYKLRWDYYYFYFLLLLFWLLLSSNPDVMLQIQDFVNIKSLSRGDVSNDNTNQTVHVSWAHFHRNITFPCVLNETTGKTFRLSNSAIYETQWDSQQKGCQDLYYAVTLQFCLWQATCSTLRFISSLLGKI